MTYNVFGGTLSLPQSVNLISLKYTQTFAAHYHVKCSMCDGNLCVIKWFNMSNDFHLQEVARLC